MAGYVLDSNKGVKKVIEVVPPLLVSFQTPIEIGDTINCNGGFCMGHACSSCN